MSRHQYDLVQCMQRPGKLVGLLCVQCDGKCPVCDSMVKPAAKARVCDACVAGPLASRCILCGTHLGDKPDKAQAYYCLECVVQDKHREGCPRITNIGSSKMDLTFRKRT